MDDALLLSLDSEVLQAQLGKISAILKHLDKAVFGEHLLLVRTCFDYFVFTDVLDNADAVARDHRGFEGHAMVGHYRDEASKSAFVPLCPVGNEPRFGATRRRLGLSRCHPRAHFYGLLHCGVLAKDRPHITAPIPVTE